MAKQFLLTFLLSAFFSVLLQAQTPLDAFMMDKGQICTAVLYTNDQWDEYWEGTLKRDNGNIGTLTPQTVTAMAAIGLTDNINLIVALPWVRTDASEGQLQGVQGLQDVGLWLKVKALSTTMGQGELSLLGVLGGTIPASNYLSDYMPLSLGLGAPEATARVVAQYHHHPSGFFVQAHTGYHLRGYTTIERDYYYTTQGYYTDQVDVPNALTFGGTVGIWLFERALRTEIKVLSQRTLGGHDIRRQDVPFPSNRFHFDQASVGFQYYAPFLKGLSVIGSGGYVLAGRNVGQSLAITGGLTWEFGAWK